MPPIYAQTYTFTRGLYDALGGGRFRVNPTIAPGDFKIAKDNGALVNMAHLPVVTPAGSALVLFTLTAVEMTASHVTILGVDQAGGEWTEFMEHIDPEPAPTTGGGGGGGGGGSGGFVPGMATVLDLITAALIKLRVHRSGANVPPEDAQDAASELARMLETWQVEGSMVSRLVDQPHTLTPGIAAYTIGTGADINVPRPVQLHDGYTTLGGVDYPYTVVHADMYNLVAMKGQAGTWPTIAYYEAAYPWGIVHLWPVPTGGTLHLILDQPFTTLGINDTLSLPPGYRDALVLALGKRLAPSYGTAMGPEYTSDYTVAMRALARANKRPVIATLRLPAVGRRGTDTSWIVTGGM